MQWLQRNPGWLIIFDNIDTADGAGAVQQLIPRLGNGYILITSRIRNSPLSILQLPLDVIGSEEGASFILESTEGVRRAGDDDVSVAKRLSALLGGLPLALAHSAAYIAHQEIRLVEYIEIFENHLDRVLQFHDSSALEYGTSVHQLGSVKTIATTFFVSFEQLVSTEKALLQGALFLGPEAIPISIFEASQKDFSSLVDLW